MTSARDLFHAILPNYANRRLEWALAMYLLYIGAVLWLPGFSMKSPTYAAALQRASESQWAAVFAAEGLILYVALQVNGRAAWTPFLRATTLFIASLTFYWFAMDLSKVHSLSMTFATYLFISLGFCGLAFSAAAFDCGREIKIWRGRHDKQH